MTVLKTRGKMKPDLPTALRLINESVKRGPLVVLVGAGASMDPPARLVSWKGLVGRMAQVAEPYQQTRAQLIREEAAESRLIEAADIFVAGDKVPKNLRAKLFCDEFDKPKTAMPEVYKLLARLPASLWITTNFDPFLKYALGDSNPEIELQTNARESFRAVLSLWTDKKFCIYLHGRAHEYDSLVFYSEAYKQLYSREDTQHLLRRVFTECAVLAYGHSCTDPDLLKIVQFVAEELGGATQNTHFLLTCDAGMTAVPLLRKANFTVIEYSASDDHAEAKKLIHEFLATKPHADSPGLVGRSHEHNVRELTTIYLALSDTEAREGTYATACAALVLQTASRVGATTDWNALVTAVRGACATDERTASQIAKTGLALLERRGLAAKKGVTIELGSTAAAGNDTDAVVDALEARVASYNSRFRPSEKTKDAFRLAVSHVMLAQGMTVARSFVREDDPHGYDLSFVAREAVARVPRMGDGIERDLEKAICEILRDPPSTLQKPLFQLAHAACSLELVFLNPGQVSLGESLRWKLFLDSNVVLRIISPANKHSKEFRLLIERCRRLGTPLAIIHPFVEEIVTHIRLQGALLNELKVQSKEALISYLGTQEENERSPILEWYASEVERRGWMPYSQFVQIHTLNSSMQIVGLLKNLGIETEGKNIKQDLDTSERETLWADLRSWRHDQSVAGRTLRRNEATQIEWLLALRQQNVRTWFLSRDGQLRRALMSLQKARYAGFVMTPTAWAHQLAQVHWGEVDVSGFAAMMWSFPSRSLEDRAREVVLQRLFADHPEAQKAEPEWLRDKVDEVFARGNLAMLFKESEAENDPAKSESSFLSALQAVIPKAVSEILDAMAKKNLIGRKK
jgi:hypothetical protein